MGDFFEDLTTTIQILNAVTGGTLLPVVALLLIVLLAAGIAWMVSRRRPLSEVADPAFNSALDRSERDLRNALTDEADRLAELWLHLDEERDR